MKEYKEQIKARMLKQASKVWGYPETASENEFDPLVSMLLSACSTELEKISNEIHTSRGRVLERLVQLLSPETLTGPIPSHGVATALPVERTTILSEATQFYAHLKSSPSATTEKEESTFRDLFFSPTDVFCLNRASVRYVATGNQLFRVNDMIEKEVVANCSYAKQLPASSLWLGIDEPDVSLHKSLFYFEFRQEEEKNLFYLQLPKAKWSINSEILQHVPGYGNQSISGERFDVKEVLNNSHPCGRVIKKQVNAFYKPRFITLMDNHHITTKKEHHQMPETIQCAFTGKEMEELLRQDLRWIHIQFPETIPSQLLQHVTCIMNCFPVINRRLHELRYRLRELINIIPLSTEELFLHLEHVNSEDTMAIEPASQKRKEEPFSMLLKNSGSGRFDERDASMIIDYMLQLLKDESAAFSSIDRDFLSNEIKQVQQVINKLEQRSISQAIPSDPIHYLIIRNKEQQSGKNLSISFWSTNGQDANYLKAGTELPLYNGISIKNNRAILVSPTKGGRNRMNTAESILAYKSALLSKERLITCEDVKAFCHYQLGEKVQRVRVEKGVSIPHDERQGYVKTINVIIALEERAYSDMKAKEELGFWEDQLKLMLEQQSSSLMPYRIIIQPAQ